MAGKISSALALAAALLSCAAPPSYELFRTREQAARLGAYVYELPDSLIVKDLYLNVIFARKAFGSFPKDTLRLEARLDFTDSSSRSYTCKLPLEWAADSSYCLRQSDFRLSLAALGEGVPLRRVSLRPLDHGERLRGLGLSLRTR